MIIEDIHGNIITNPNLEKGRLEKSYRMDDEEQPHTIFIYFPFNEDEQEAYNANNQGVITNDRANCIIYESTKDTTKYSDVDPFCYSYARRIKRDELIVKECPEELRERIEEIVNGEKPAGKKCRISASAQSGGWADIEDEYDRNTTITVRLWAEEGFRVPTEEEFETNINAFATDDEGYEIENFKPKCVSYRTEKSEGYADIYIPDNCQFVSIWAECVKE